MASRAPVGGRSFVADDEPLNVGRWLVGVGALLAVLGLVALATSVLTTFLTVELLGILLVIGGIAQAVHAVSSAAWRGFFLSLLAGALYIVVGVLALARPVETAMALTLLFAAFLMVTGVFRILAVAAVPLPNRGWVLLAGIVTLLLGVGLWASWPVSSLWLIGAYVGIEMFLSGLSLVMLAEPLRARRRPIAHREAA